MWFEAILIILGFVFHIGLKRDDISEMFFLIAGILGIMPLLLDAISALRFKVISIDVLVSIAAIGALFIKNYEESAIVTFLFLFGAYLEGKTLEYTRRSIKELVEFAPESAYVKDKDGEFVEVDIDDVDISDIIMVKTGAKVPVDGVIIKGEAYLNESSITGESMPLGKGIGDDVYAGTILENGTLEIEALAVGEDTTFGKIIELVEEAQDSKSDAEKFIDKFSKWYTPTVIIFSLLVGLITRNIELMITVLVLGCPGALVIGVPVSSVAGIGNGAKNGILLKGSEIIENLSKIDTIIFDKTGTLTKGEPEVNEVIYYDDFDDQYIKYIYAIEKESDHPIAKSITDYYNLENYPTVDSTDVIKGLGIVSKIDNKNIAIGNLSLMESLDYKINDKIYRDEKRLQEEGNSIVLVAVDGKIVTLIGIMDKIRDNIKEELQKMKELGIKNLMVLSGDNQGAVDNVQNKLDLNKALGNLLPEDKAAYLKNLQTNGEIVAFVGDGINDAPSLALSDVGIAMGSGTDVAIETSDLVLVKSDFKHLNHAIGLSKSITRNMKENIIISIAVVIILILMLFFSKYMNMALGMLIHEGSILLVILNAMRLLRYKLTS